MFRNLCLLVFFFSCTTFQAQIKGFDYGKWRGNVYSNSFFGIEMKVPKDWFIQTEEEKKELMEFGKVISTDKNSIERKIVEAAEVNSANLITAFKYELGTTKEYNSSFVLLVENLKIFPAIKTGDDYLFNAKKFMQNSKIEIEFLNSDFSKVSIGGYDFYKMDTKMVVYGIDVYQSYYSTITKNFSFNFIISYSNDDQKKELENIIYSLKNI